MDLVATGARIFIRARDDEDEPHRRPLVFEPGNPITFVNDDKLRAPEINKARKRNALPVQLREDGCFLFREATFVAGKLLEKDVSIAAFMLEGVSDEALNQVKPQRGLVEAPVLEFVLPCVDISNFYITMVRLVGRAALAQHLFSNVGDMRLTVLSRRGRKPMPYVIEAINLLYKDVFRDIRFVDALDTPTFLTPIDPIGSMIEEPETTEKPVRLRSLRRSTCLVGEALSGISTEDGPKRIFISREKAKTRKVANEAEHEAFFRDLGFTKVALEDHSLLEQLQLIRSAEVIVGPHGAGMAHLSTCRPGTCFIELTSRQYIIRGVNNFDPVAVARGVNYHLLYCNEDGDTEVRLEQNVGNDILLTDAAIKKIAELVEASQHVAA